MERSIAIKKYINQQFVKENPGLTHAVVKSREHQLPEIHIPAQVGKLISILTRLKAPKRVLEIGTLGGYSTLWIASALTSEASITCIEIDPRHAQIAADNIEFAGFSEQVHILVGDAAAFLSQMIDEQAAPFDLIFIDADKHNYPKYLKLILPLTASGTLILSDNLIPKSEEINPPKPGDTDISGIYEYNRLIAEHPNLESIISTTIVGEKGRIDGLGITLVK